MAIRKWLIFLLLAAVSVLAGCSGGSTFNVQNPTANGSSSISIAFQSAPPASVPLNGSASVTANVTHDPNNAGVDWVLSCQNGNCGSLSAPHTASGQAVTFNPPPTLSGNSQSVTVIAFATADHSKNVSASLQISAFGSVLKGTYILETSGNDGAGFVFQRAAAVVLDGNGGVTSGEQTVDYMSPVTGTLTSVSDPIIGGSYFVGADGRGALVINTADQNVGTQGTCASVNGNIPCGIQTFSIVVLSTSQALIAYQDTQEVSRGTMDLQTSMAAPANAYAFVASGTDVNVFNAVVLGGVLNIDSPGAISGARSEVDAAYNDGSGLVTDPDSAVTGTVSGSPDGFGAVPIALQVSNPNGFTAAIQFTAYIVDATHMKLIETDTNPNSGASTVFGVTVGVAIGQDPAAVATFTTNQALHGAYVFGVLGTDDGSLGSPSFLPTLSSAGIFTASGGLLSSGFLDEFQYQNGTDLAIQDHFSGNYFPDPLGTGRVDTLPSGSFTSSITFSNVNNGTGPELVFYATGVGKPALVLDADIEPALPPSGGIGTGIAYPATNGAVFSGDYGLSFAQDFPPNPSQAFGTGQICVNGSSVVCPSGTVKTLSGILDTNSAFAPQGSTPVTDGFQTSAVARRLTGTLSNISFPSTISNQNGGQIAVAYYLVDSGHGFFVETDGGANNGGVNPGNLTFGYFQVRTPVCAGCP